MAVEQTLSEEEDADEASPPRVRLTCGFEKAMLKVKKYKQQRPSFQVQFAYLLPEPLDKRRA